MNKNDDFCEQCPLKGKEKCDKNNKDFAENCSKTMKSFSYFLNMIWNVNNKAN